MSREDYVQPKRVLVSFSGGRTSAFMSYMMKLRAETEWALDLRFVFANTGQEDERTLEFVNECDRRWKLGVAWVEAVVHPKKGDGTTHEVVDFRSATRGSKLFKEMSSKYGIPSKNYPHCTRELKLHPIWSYLKSIGWESGSYESAVGIRADEVDRMSAKPNMSYPLVKAGVTKEQVSAWWAKRDFDLMVPEHFGNCVTCFKKSQRKLMTIAKERPSAFEMNLELESEFGTDSRPNMFRSRMTTLDILTAAKQPFEPFVDGRFVTSNDDQDKPDGCSESCDAFSEDAP